MKNWKLFAFVALVLLMVVAACGGGKTTAEPTQAVPAATALPAGGEPAATEPAEAQPTSEPAAQPTPEPTSGPTEVAAQPTEETVDLGGIAAGLTSLKSYKSTLDMRFSGTNAAGEAVERSWSMAEQFIADPPAKDMSWQSSESAGGAAPVATGFRTISIGTATYWISEDAGGEPSCTVMTSQDATPPEQTLDPDMWGDIQDAVYVGTETVNGVQAKHYRWQESALIGWGFLGGKGETWVAVDGGYAVRQTIEATGKEAFLASADETGTTTWEWNVTDINGSFQIVPPEGCESAASGLPIMADATEQTTMGDMISYSTPTAFADVVDFYKAEMPKAGWEPTGTPAEMEGFSSIEFAKGTSKATVMITWDESSQKTTVLVSVTEQD